jgi:hypothetical protein
VRAEHDHQVVHDAQPNALEDGLEEEPLLG